MSTVEEAIELMNGLPEELQAEVRDFARFVKDTRIRRPHGKMKLDWRGGLSDMRDEFTSVELQHKALDWWIEAALDGCPSAKAIRRELKAVRRSDRPGLQDMGRDAARRTNAAQRPPPCSQSDAAKFASRARK